MSAILDRSMATLSGCRRGVVETVLDLRLGCIQWMCTRLQSQESWTDDEVNGPEVTAEINHMKRRCSAPEE